jgi:hypothetical protein
MHWLSAPMGLRQYFPLLQISRTLVICFCYPCEQHYKIKKITDFDIRTVTSLQVYTDIPNVGKDKNITKAKDVSYY